MARREYSRGRVGMAVAVAVALATGGLPRSVRPAAATASVSSQIVRFDAVKYGATGCATITVQRGQAGDPDPDPQLEVGAASGDHEMLNLTPTGPDTWTASVCSKPGPINVGDGVLQVQPGDGLLAATFTAGSPSGIDTALVSGGGAGNGTVSVTLNPQPFPPAPKKIRSIPNPDFASGIGPKTLKNAMLIQPDGSRVYFAEDQVIVRESAPGDLRAFQSRHPGALVLNSVTVPGDDTNPDASPQPTTYYDLYVNANKYPTGDMASQLQAAGASGQFTFTSTRAMQLYALILDEQAGGTQVFPNTLAVRDSVPSTNEAMASSKPIDLFNSPATNPWYQGSDPLARRVGAPQTIALLDVMKQDQQPHAELAIIDAGFAGPTDYGNNFTPPDYGAPNGDFNQIPQCSANLVGKLSCGPGQAAGANPMPCKGGFGVCPWHGAQMAAVAAGRVDNGSPTVDGGGSAGIGGDTADLMLYKADWSYFLPLISSIQDATMKGAQVINLSSGFPCMQFIDLCDSGARTATKIALSIACFLGGFFLGIGCALAGELLDKFADVDGLQKEITNAIAAGVVVVASAGNDGKDLASDKTVPCNFPGVLCVGNLALGNGDLVAASSSNFGTRVDLWSPGTTVGNFPTPKLQTKSDGTSPAAAFTSGVATIVRAIVPNLPGAQVRQLLLDAVCRTRHETRLDGSSCAPSSDPKVDANGYLDVLDVLQRARAAASLPSLGQCSGGWDQAPLGSKSNDNPAYPIEMPGSPVTYAQFGVLSTWSGDATVKRASFTAGGQPDGQYYRLRFDQSSIPPNSQPADNVRIQLHTPDPSLGGLTLEVYAITQAGYGAVPPTLKEDFPFHLVDTASGGGTGEWDGYLLVHKDYLLHVVATNPEAQNNNCFDQIQVTAIRGAGNPPPRDPGLELGSANVIVGRQASSSAGFGNVAILPITLTQPMPFDVDVTYTTFDIPPNSLLKYPPATAGVDYVATSGTLTMLAGQTYAEIHVPIFPRSKPGAFVFGAKISQATAPIYEGTTFVGILDPAAKQTMPVAEVAAAATFEGDVAFTRGNAIVQLDRPAPSNVVVQYTLTSTDSQLGVDWNGSGGNIVIPKGQTYAVVHFSIFGDTVPESDEHVHVTLTGVSTGNATIGPRSSDDVQIMDDDNY